MLLVTYAVGMWNGYSDQQQLNQQLADLVQALGAGTGSCVAIEDSPTGVASARAAAAPLRTAPSIVGGQPVPVPRLVDCLWPDRPPARPSQQISVLVSRLRSVLGPDRLPRSDAGYQLLADWIDLDVANHLATAA